MTLRPRSFSIIGVMYAVLLAFVAMLAWEGFNRAKAASYVEAALIGDVYSLAARFCGSRESRQILKRRHRLRAACCDCSNGRNRQRDEIVDQESARSQWLDRMALFFGLHLSDSGRAATCIRSLLRGD